MLYFMILKFKINLFTFLIYVLHLIMNDSSLQAIPRNNNSYNNKNKNNGLTKYNFQLS